ncbi:hypothetical protein Fot_56620 [Forsythia ovata]|uniref:Uncharacterized protein n=1 Tax=Forsythia ovata TaxID=205694 RepID=A0ABD1NZ54_9LAMI
MLSSILIISSSSITASVSEVVIPQALEAILGASTAVLLVSGIAVGISSVILLEDTLLPSEDIRRSGKRKIVADDEGEAAVPRRGTEGDGSSEDSQKTKRDRETPSWGAEEHASHRSRGMARPSILFPGWFEYINIGSRQDELDPAIFEKLPPSSDTVAASVHKYWTFVWSRTTEGTDLSELIRMAEMNTTRSHVLNCKLYKVLVMKVDEQRSTVVGAEDIDEMRLENQTLQLELTAFEDTKA